jgi:hypothetical protein
MSDRDDLVALGFAVDGNGALRVRDASVTLTPEGDFYRVELSLPRGVVTCHIGKAALKLAPPSEIDVDALIVPTSRRRPW